MEGSCGFAHTATELTYARMRLPRFVIAKTPGSLPLPYKGSELAETLCVPDRKLARLVSNRIGMVKC